jgi:hypothetical protein
LIKGRKSAEVSRNLPARSIVFPAQESVKEFGIARFLTLRQAQDEEMDGIFTSC